GARHPDARAVRTLVRVGRPTPDALCAGTCVPGHRARSGGGGGWRASAVGSRAGARLGRLRRGPGVGAAGESARDPPLATRRRAGPDPRRAVSSTASGARGNGRGVAPESAADGHGGAHHAFEGPGRPARCGRSLTARLAGLNLRKDTACARTSYEPP